MDSPGSRSQPTTADELADLDAVAQAELVRRGDVSPTELVDAAIERIERLDPGIGAVITPLFDHAREEAAGSLPDGPFRGVPLLLKDLDGAMGGVPYHCGMRALKDAGYVPDHDDTNIARLRAAGFVVVGKTNVPELGLLPATEPAAYPATRNPWDAGRSAGGSSGGSAAAVAAGMVAVATAGDGGGSIRIPSSENGIFGIKPTRGRVPMGPDLGEGWAGLTVRGVVTRTVRDTAAALDVLAGRATGDPYDAPLTGPYGAEVGRDPGRLRIGLRVHPPGDGEPAHPECVAAVTAAARLLEELGHHVEQAGPEALDTPELATRFFPAYGTWAAGDVDRFGAAIGRTLGPDDVEPGTWALVEMGRATTAPQYLAALDWMHAWARRVAAWWEHHDLLLTPTIPEPPPALGSFAQPADNPLQGALRAAAIVPFMVPFNVTGQPAMSVPLHWSADGLPIGVQLVAAFGREDVLVRLAAQLEDARPWAGRRPPLPGGTGAD